MRILIGNDDGIDAPGLALAEAAAARLHGAEVWTVAPDAKRTAASNALTIARPMTLVQRAERRWACSGTPADGIVAAMTWLLRDGPRPDLVIAGVNDGKNVAEDIAYSGTLGVAREATMWGLPAVALSRVKEPEVRPGDVDWLAGLLARLWTARADWLAPGCWLSVNLPARLPAPVRQARIGAGDKIATVAEVLEEGDGAATLLVPRGRPNGTAPGDENDLLAQGCAAVTRLAWAGEARLPEGWAEAL